MVETLNERQPDTLPSYIVQNPKNYDNYLIITTRSGMTTVDPYRPVINKTKNDSVNIDQTPKVEIEKLISGGKNMEKDKGKEKVVELMMKNILRPLLCFTQKMIVFIVLFFIGCTPVYA